MKIVRFNEGFELQEFGLMRCGCTKIIVMEWAILGKFFLKPVPVASVLVPFLGNLNTNLMNLYFCLL